MLQKKSSCHCQKACIFANIFLLIVCFCLVATTVYFARKAHHDTSNDLIDRDKQSWFFHISDIHLDIYYNESVALDSHCRSVPMKGGSVVNFTNNTAKFGRVSCDSPLALVSSAADAIDKLNKDLPGSNKFILLTGRFCF